MIAPRELPKSFDEWNRKHGAPYGRRVRVTRWAKRVLPLSLCLRVSGPFAVQPNNTTRLFEYPWAFHATPLAAGLKVLEIGGGLSGFQFHLDRHGCQVVNVDPGLEAKGVGWPCDASSMAKLNRLFGTGVELRNTVVADAHLEAEAYDRVFAISVLEHLPDEEADDAMRGALACLKPGGFCMLTVDLFLDIEPFTSQNENRFGKNASVRRLVEAAPFALVQGDPKELYGFDEFSADRVQSHLADYFIGMYPALTQCLVLQKPIDTSGGM